MLRISTLEVGVFVVSRFHPGKTSGWIEGEAKLKRVTRGDNREALHEIRVGAEASEVCVSLAAPCVLVQRPLCG